jgi:hypothetical protein
LNSVAQDSVSVLLEYELLGTTASLLLKTPIDSLLTTWTFREWVPEEVHP